MRCKPVASKSLQWKFKVRVKDLPYDEGFSEVECSPSPVLQIFGVCSLVANEKLKILHFKTAIWRTLTILWTIYRKNLEGIYYPGQKTWDRFSQSCSIKRLLEDEELCCWTWDSHTLWPMINHAMQHLQHPRFYKLNKLSNAPRTLKTY